MFGAVLLELEVVVGSVVRKKVTDQYQPNGVDRITNAPDAEVLIVYAKTEPTKGSKGITAFVCVPTSDLLSLPQLSLNSS